MISGLISSVVILSGKHSVYHHILFLFSIHLVILPCRFLEFVASRHGCIKINDYSTGQYVTLSQSSEL